MKVRDLINLLLDFNPNAEVFTAMDNMGNDPAPVLTGPFHMNKIDDDGLCFDDEELEEAIKEERVITGVVVIA